MTPEIALNIIMQAAQQAPLPLVAHQQVIAAAEVLKKLLEKKD